MTIGERRTTRARARQAPVGTKQQARSGARRPGRYHRPPIPPVRTIPHGSNQIGRSLPHVEDPIARTALPIAHHEEVRHPLQMREIGAHVKERSIDYLVDTLSGVISSVIIFLFGLILFRIGFSSSPDLQFEILSPSSLFNSFKSLVLQLSTYQEFFLLGAVGVLAVITGFVTYLWLRDRRIDPADKQHWAAKLAGPLSSLRTVSFFFFATLTVIGAYAYQQYLWRVALPIPHEALGIAITREAAAASFQDQLADALYTQGQSQSVVVRELPVNFDASDTGRARALGKRIGAEAVIIYRSEKVNGKTQYIAYLVFTDPKQGLTIGAPPLSGSTSLSAAQSPVMVQIKQGVEIPALTTNTLSDMVNAAAGVIAYNDGRYRQAITHLQLAVPKSSTAPATGPVNFYLGRSLDFDSQTSAAASAYERTIAYYEGLQKSGTKLGPRDELQYLQACLWRGKLAAEAQQWSQAESWYQRGITVRDDLLARSTDLTRPSEVRYTYSLLFSSLAESYGNSGDRDNQQYWQNRTTSELKALVAASNPHDVQALIDESTARFYSGDCAGAAQSIAQALKLAPKNTDALNNAGVIDFVRGDNVGALQSFQTITRLDPTNVSAHQMIGNLNLIKGLALTSGYIEPVYLKQASAAFGTVVQLDPTNLAAHDNLASIDEYLAQGQTADLTGLVSDQTVYDKSATAWPADPARRKAALGYYNDAITERRVIATELLPGNPTAQVALAAAYNGRQQMLFSSFYQRDPATDPDFKSDGQQIIADGQPVMEWTGKVLAKDSGASRVDRLQAWNVRLSSLDDVWGWYEFYAKDPAKAQATQQTYLAAVKEAGAYADAAKPTTSEEMSAVATIYLKEAFVALAFDNDQAGYEQWLAKAQALQQQSLTAGTAETVNLVASKCVEQSDAVAGNTALAKGDLTAAKTQFQAALALDPDLSAARDGLSRVLYQQGDTKGAITQATTGTQHDPENPRFWQDLGLYQLAAGNTTESDNAYGRFFALVASLPPQERMATLKGAIADVQDLLMKQPAAAAGVRQLLPSFATALDTIGEAGKGTYQYPALYGALGQVALFADDAKAAQPLLEKSLQLDPHQPDVHAWGVIALVAQQRDPAQAIAAAIDETRDKLWENAGGADAQLAAMGQQVSAYVKQFPERGTDLKGFTDAIAAERQRLQSGAPAPAASPAATPAASPAATPAAATPEAAGTSPLSKDAPASGR